MTPEAYAPWAWYDAVIVVAVLALALLLSYLTLLNEDPPEESK